MPRRLLPILQRYRLPTTMADAELSAKISTTSDIPDAMDKAKKATVSFEKQVQDVQKKFSTGLKDIFLGFTAPMVLIQNAISLISEAIAKAKQDAKDGLDLLAKGETTYATSEEKKMANFFKRRADSKEEQRLVEAGKSELAGQFIKTPEGDKLATDMAAKRISQLGVGAQIDISALKDSLKGDKQFQDAALKAFLESPEGKAYQPIFDSKKDQNFKGPEGFSNVVGVGANPVMEAMAAQTEIALQQLAELQKLNANSGNAGVPTDFTKDTK